MFSSGSDGPILLSTPSYTPSMPTFAGLLPSFWGARDSVQEPTAWRHRAWTSNEKQCSMCELMSHHSFAKEMDLGLRLWEESPPAALESRERRLRRPLSKANLYKKLCFPEEWRKGGLCSQCLFQTTDYWIHKWLADIREAIFCQKKNRCFFECFSEVEFERNCTAILFVKLKCRAKLQYTCVFTANEWIIPLISELSLNKWPFQAFPIKFSVIWI